MEESLRELLTFLDSDLVTVQQETLGHLLGVSTTPGCVDYWRRHVGQPWSRRLFALALSDHQFVAHDAFRLLTNIACDEVIAAHYGADESNIAKLFDIVSDRKHLFSELASMVLANLTKTEIACRHLLQLEEPKLEGCRLLRLVDIFQTERGKYNPNATYDFLACVFANVSQWEFGRRALLNRQRAILGPLLPFTEDRNELRRGNIVSAIKNCCFEVASHGWLFEQGIVRFVVTPLAKRADLNDEERKEAPAYMLELPPDHSRESNSQICTVLLECILLLGSTREGRQKLRDAKVYPTLRELHKDNSEGAKSERVDEVIQDIVGLLIRDEEPLPVAVPVPVSSEEPNPKPSSKKKITILDE